MRVNSLPTPVEHSFHPQYVFHTHQALFNCLSDNNEFIPISALVNGTRFACGDRKILYYNLEFPTSESSRYLHKNMQDFCNRFMGTSYSYTNTGKWAKLWMKAYREDKFFTYWTTYGTMLYTLNEYDENNPAMITKENVFPLMVLCVRKSQLFNLVRGQLMAKDFVIVVNCEFENVPQHNKLYRNVKRLLIDELKASSPLDIVYTRQMERIVFNSTLPNQSYNTIEEMEANMASVNKAVIQELLTA